MSRTDLIVVAGVVTALIAFASLAVYANANMQSSALGYRQNQGYGSGMMGGGSGGNGMMGGFGGGMMGGYYPNQGYQQQAAPNNNNQPQQYYGQGMMGGGGYRTQTGQGTTNQSLAHCSGVGGAAGGVGMMGSAGGMMGGMGGMMGYYPQAPTAALTHENATKIAKNFLASLHNSNLKIGEFEEYSHNFYVSIVDNSTGKGVAEILIDRFTGLVHPEPQSMMWSNNFGGMMGGMMGGRFGNQGNGAITVTPDQAKKIAQSFLNVTYPGTTVEDITTFDGYYTIMTTLNGKDYGMLSVNGYTGAVWYHVWHGMFLGDVETP